MSKIALKVEEISQLDPMNIATHDAVRDKFIQIYEAAWTPTTGVSGEAVYEKEARNFNRILSEKEDVRTQCTRFSLFTAFLDVAISGLSLEPGARAQAYLMSRSINIGSYMGNDRQKKAKYETQAVLTISGYGELLHRARCGQIRYADNPVIVYAEDTFEYGERDGSKFVNFICRMPHTSGNIVACYIKITRNDGSVDYSVMLPEDWSRLAGFSERQNRRYDYQAKQWVSGKANALYGKQSDGTCKIDTGFLVAKCIKHAFKSYPKARIGRGTQLESQQTEDFEINNDLYGLDDGTTVDQSTGEVITPKDTGFAPQQDTSAGVTIDPTASTNENGDSDDVF